jgi:serine/threonine protein kinase
MTTGIGIGSAMGGYTLEAVLGRGGMSVVYIAEDSKLGRRVALKIMSEELSENEAFRTRFIREAKMAANLEHPSIVPVYDAGEVDGVLFLAMRVIRGTDLRRVITEGGPMDAERTMAIMRQVASALDAAHQAGLVHRDVKPANILLSKVGEDEHAYLSDFGLTKHVSSRSGLTKTGTFMGTIDYVAPEQIRGDDVDGRTDLYSLACVLYECLTGEVPFMKDQDVAILFAHLEDARPRITAKRPDLPEAVDGVLARAMAKTKDERFDTCIGFVHAAREALVFAPAASGTVGTVIAAPPTILAAPPTTETSPPATETSPPETGELEPHPSFPPLDEPSIAPAAAAVTDAPLATSPTVSVPPMGSVSNPTVPAPPEVSRTAPPSVPPPAGGPSAPPERRRRALVIAAIVVALAVVGGVAAVALTGGEDRAANGPTPNVTTQPPTPSPSPSPSEQVEPPPGVRAPINPRATGVSSDSLTLRWRAAPLGSPPVRFLVFRDGKQIKKVLDTTFVDRKVDPSTTYVYRIVAVGADGSQARSETLEVTTPAAPSSGGSNGGSSGGSGGCSVEDFLAGLC